MCGEGEGGHFCDSGGFWHHVAHLQHVHIINCAYGSRSVVVGISTPYPRGFVGIYLVFNLCSFLVCFNQKPYLC